MTAMTRTSQREGRRIGLLTALVIAAAQVASIALGIGAPVQPVLSIVFVLTVPGFLLFDLEKPGDTSARLLISIGASLSLNVVIAAVALVADMRWTAPAVVLVLLVAVATLPGDHMRALAARPGSNLRRATQAPPVRSDPTDADLVGLPVADSSAIVEPDELDHESADLAEQAAAYAPLAPETVPSAPLIADRHTRGGETAASLTDPHDAVTASEAGVDNVPESETRKVPVPSEAAAALKLVDVNAADARELQSLPGVGPALAAAIVDHRESHGLFETVTDLVDVPGIGPSKLRRLANRATIGSLPPLPPEPKSPDATPEPDPAAGILLSSRPRPVDAPGTGAEEAAPIREPVEVDTVRSRPTAADAARMNEAAAGPSDMAQHQTPASPPAVRSDRAPSPRPAAASWAPRHRRWWPEPSSQTVDINRATAAELSALPGIGPSLAGRIVAHRDAHGPFRSLADLESVSGLGRAKARDLSGLVLFERTAVNINTATAVQLSRVDGIALELGHRIVSHRELYGNFTSLDRLIDVTGVDPVELEQLRDSLTV